MSRTAHFRVDLKLAHVLGESYTSSEKALKELVENAWDADGSEKKKGKIKKSPPTASAPSATSSFILPTSSLKTAPIIVQDNGSGMKTAELEAEYLNIASPRFSRKGDRTPNLNRTVKGRKGIGKFAGLILASEMELVTQAAGKRTRGLISKTVLMEALGDLEKVPLPLDVADSDPLDAHGTTITLRNLNPKLSHLQPDKLKELLALDYGREPSFVIFVNGERVFHHDIKARSSRPKSPSPTARPPPSPTPSLTNPCPAKNQDSTSASAARASASPTSSASKTTTPSPTASASASSEKSIYPPTPSNSPPPEAMSSRATKASKCSCRPCPPS